MTSDSDPVEVEITCPDLATARAIGDALLGARLAACVNIHAGIESRYRWQGAVETAREVPMTVKTRAGHFAALCARVRALHPYDTPDILARGIALADPAFAAWIVEETG